MAQLVFDDSVPSRAFAPLLAQARDVVQENLEAKAPRRPQKSTRTSAEPNTATEARAEERYKHNCWARRRDFLQQLFTTLGSTELRADRPTMKVAAERARITCYRTAQT